MRFFWMRDADRLIFDAAMSKNFSSFSSASVGGWGGGWDGGLAGIAFGVGESPAREKAWFKFCSQILQLNLTQNDVDQAILHQCHEHENCTNWHERIDSFQIRHRRQARLRLCMLRWKGEKWCNAECDTSWSSFGFDPEWDPLNFEKGNCVINMRSFKICSLQLTDMMTIRHVGMYVWNR